MRQAIINYQKKAITMSTLEGGEGYGAASELTLDEIERILTVNRLTSHKMHTHPDFEHTYLVEVGGEKHQMTFDRDVWDRQPDLGFMTYGHPVFDALLSVRHE